MGGPEREGKKENGKNEMRRKGDVTRTPPLSFMTYRRHCLDELNVEGDSTVSIYLTKVPVIKLQI